MRVVLTVFVLDISGLEKWKGVCPIFLDNTLFSLAFQGLSDADGYKSKCSLIVAGPGIEQK